MPEFKKGAALMEKRAVELEKEGSPPPSLQENSNRTSEGLSLIDAAIQEYVNGPRTQERANATWQILWGEWGKIVDRVNSLIRTSGDSKA